MHRVTRRKKALSRLLTAKERKPVADRQNDLFDQVGDLKSPSRRQETRESRVNLSGARQKDNQFFGKPGSDFTSSSWSVCRAVCPGITKANW